MDWATWSHLALFCLTLVVSADAMEPATRVVVCSVYEEQPRPTIANHGVTRTDFHWLNQAYPGASALRGLIAEPSHGERSQSTVVVGCTPNIGKAIPLRMKRGRFLTPRDQAQAENVCVVNEKLAARLFGRVDPIGKNVRLLDAFYLVVGISADSSQQVCRTHLRSIHREVKYDTQMFLPLKTMQARMGDVHVFRADGAFSAHSYSFSEIWVPGDKEKVEAILRRSRPRDSELRDLFVTRRVFGVTNE